MNKERIITRRGFLRLAGAASVSAILSACNIKPNEQKPTFPTITPPHEVINYLVQESILSESETKALSSLAEKLLSNKQEYRNWSLEIPFSEWKGIEIKDNHVIEIYIDLHGRPKIATIPPELGNLENLEALTINGDGLTGPIPPELGNLKNLESLRVRGPLTGSIPPELGNLKNLESLYINGSGLTGSIPPELGNLKNLESLRVRGPLTGSIPPELGNLKNLESLYINGDGLTGPIPPELDKLRKLQFLVIEGDGLTGPIPPELDKLENLEALTINGDGLTGPIPPELGNLENLGFLSIGDSGIEDIPASIMAILEQNFGMIKIANSTFSKKLGPEGIEHLKKTYPGIVFIIY